MQNIVDNYVIKRIDKLETPESPLRLVLENKSGEYKSLMKDNKEEFLANFKCGDMIKCSSVKENNILNIVYVKKLKQKKTIDADFYINKCEWLIDKVQDKDYKILLARIFNDKDIIDLFFNFPAAKSRHHAYTHGLIQHSVEVAEIALFIGKYYQANLDLLITAALLHDIGKIRSYDFEDDKIQKTNWEHLLGHLPISALFVSKIIPEDFDLEKAMLLYHLILSHHGKLTSGSPVECKTLESFILFQADDISAKCNYINNLQYGKDGWSQPDKYNREQWFKL